jgi:hypothetical protein
MFPIKILYAPVPHTSHTHGGYKLRIHKVNSHNQSNYTYSAFNKTATDEETVKDYKNFTLPNTIPTIYDWQT